MGAPNLFDFATSELSQDAFICWLASWADPECRANNEALHATAIAFLDRLLAIGKGPQVAQYRSIKVHRQWNDIDVPLVVNGDTTIIIEDKTETKDHSGQLDRYKKAVASEFSEDRIAALYLKTGDQSNYRSVEAAGYGCFLRKDFLGVLDQGERAGVKNDIFADFHSRLRRIEEAVQSYQNLPLAEWGKNPYPWRGFYLAVQQQLGGGEWDQTGHPGGNSLAFRWNWRDNTFLRLEGEELCFRVRVDEESQRLAKWTELKKSLVAVNGKNGLTLSFPTRRLGLHMGVAALDGDYRQADEKGLLNMEKTVEILRSAESLIDAGLGLLQSQKK